MGKVCLLSYWGCFGTLSRFPFQDWGPHSPRARKCWCLTVFCWIVLSSPHKGSLHLFIGWLCGWVLSSGPLKLRVRGHLWRAIPAPQLLWDWLRPLLHCITAPFPRPTLALSPLTFPRTLPNLLHRNLGVLFPGIPTHDTYQDHKQPSWALITENEGVIINIHVKCPGSWTKWAILPTYILKLISQRCCK